MTTVALDAPMDELDIAKAISRQELPSPQKYQNLYLFDLRITGTGMAFRSAHQEYVWRDPTLYLTPRFLERCQGLPVILEHPDKGSLNSDEFHNRVIGTITFAFIVGDEVHGIAKIFDDAAADMMMNEQLSTSPGVVLRDVNDKVDFEDGSVLLIEGVPMLHDHIAVVPNGVWDKGGPPTGVVNSTLRMDSMTEQTKEVEVAARADAETSAKLDKMMNYLSSLTDGMGAISSRVDAMEKAAKARADAEEDDKKEKADKARKDAKARRDAERADWAKSDAEACAKDDADEDADCEKFKKDGDDEEMAADKARSARKDRMKARKDADDEKEKEKEKDDAAAKNDAAMQARVDALIADNEKLKAQVNGTTAQLAMQPISPNDPNYVSFSDAQFAADAAYQAFGKAAPAPMSGESILGYRRRLATGLKQHSKDWKDIELAALPDAALAVAERKIIADAMTASKSSDDVAEGIMIPRKRTTESGHHVTEYRGRTTIFQAMSSPPLFATKFNTERRA